MAHSHEYLLGKLLEKLQHPQVMVFVHIDKKSQPLFEKLSVLYPSQMIRDRVNVQWAHLSQVLAMFSSYKEIRSGGYDFSHFLVVSGQDQPVKPMDELVNFLTSQPGKSFLSYVALSKEGWAGAMKRYRYHYYVRMEKLWRGLMMLTGIRRQFPFGLNPFGGAQWVNLSKKHFDYVIEFCEKHVSLMKFMETVRFPEEMLFQTLLINSEYKKDCINNDLRYVKWLPGRSNPEILTEDHMAEIKGEPDKFFARKFDKELSAVLLKKLDEEIK